MVVQIRNFQTTVESTTVHTVDSYEGNPLERWIKECFELMTPL